MANKLQGPYAVAVANTEDLRIRLARSERERHEQVRRAQVLQQKMMQKEAEKEHLHKETDKAENERKAVENELEAVQEKLRRETAATEMERLARRYAQLKVQQLQALEINYSNSMKGLRNEMKEVTEVSASTVAEADLQQNVEQIRQDYANTSAKLSNDFEKRARKFEQMWNSESRVVDELKHEIDDLKQKIAPLGCLQHQNSELRAKLDALKRDLIAAEQNRDVLYKKFEAANRHSQELKKIIEGEHVQMGGSAKLYGALADYRDIVEGELVPNQQGIQPKGIVHTTKVVEEKTMRKETGLGHQ